MAAKGPLLKLYIDETGLSREDILAIGTRARDAKPVLRAIQGLMAEGAKEQFEGEGSRGGLRWEPDSKMWAARKRREGKDEHTEIRTGDLRAALMSTTGGGNAIRRLSKASTTFGVRLFYSAFQGHRRQLLVITTKDQDRWASMMLDWVLEGKTV